MENLKKLVGSNIREIRKMKKLTQEELSEKSGLQTSFLAGVERGERNITLETLDKIVFGLDVDVKILFNFENLNINEHHTKKELIGLLSSLLAERSLDEIKLIYKISKEIFENYKE